MLPFDSGGSFDVGPIDSGNGDGGPGSDGGRDGGPRPDGWSGDGGANPNNPNNDEIDTDCDGLSDAYEFSTIYPGGRRTDPENPDTDGDGIPDGVEVGVTQAVPNSGCANVATDADPTTTSSPNDTDSDGDGILDGDEDANQNGSVDTDESNPRSTDSDGDGLPDNVEDADRDGVRDPGELNPGNRDSDGDGIADGVEDRDHDGVVDSDETDPLDDDSDDDGLVDGDEDLNHNGIREPFETDPRSTDSDCDGISDADEVAAGASPLVTDTDGDGLSDGIEMGSTGALPGSNCSNVPVDADPNWNTDPLYGDSDGDGVPDGVEDANRNGAHEMGELDPWNPDSDGDGLSDGDEVAAGSDPMNGNDPASNPGITEVCTAQNLRPVDFDIGAGETWTSANEPSTTYADITVNATGSGVELGALDDATNEIAGFVVRLPLLAGAAANSADQNAALVARMNAGAAGETLALTARISPRHTTSHDGFQTGVAGVFEVVANNGRRAAAIRNAFVRLVTNLAASDFTGLPTGTGSAETAHVFSYQVLVRTSPAELIVVGAVLERVAFDAVADNRAFIVNDLTNGTALALANARVDRKCDPFVSTGQGMADFLWMADISGSTNDDRDNIANAGVRIFDELALNNVNFRMGVVPHVENDIMQGANTGGDMRNPGFTTDRATFEANLRDTTDTNQCEFGLDAVDSAIAKALPRSAAGTTNARKLRANSILAVVYISDEFPNELTMTQADVCNAYTPSCNTGIGDAYYPQTDDTVCSVNFTPAQRTCIDSVVQPYTATIQNNNGIAFAQVIVPNANPTACNNYRCCTGMNCQARNEPGVGYVDVVNATGGAFYSPCSPNPGAALTAIVNAVAGAASQYQLSGSPISATIKVGVARIGAGGNGSVQIVPRDKDDGFDYDPVANTIYFRGDTYFPNDGDRVVVSYRMWRPPPTPCGGPCPQGQACNPQTGICGCDEALCAQNCDPTEVCDATCQCACTPDCNGQCGPGQVCNQASCQCECPSDCGGTCPAGTTCDPVSCSCVCDGDCSGACAGTNLECNTNACNCQCPADCGGICPAGVPCNPNTCECGCPANCDDLCPGNATCNSANNCACECPADCGGCPDNSECNQTTCTCECGSACDQACPNRMVCDPNDSCDCICPADCGGCLPNEMCDQNTCECKPIV